MRFIAQMVPVDAADVADNYSKPRVVLAAEKAGLVSPWVGSTMDFTTVDEA